MLRTASSEQFCPKAKNSNPLDAEPETDFNAKWPFKVIYTVSGNKKLSYYWETVRRESMPRIAEMDVEMTT